METLTAIPLQPVQSSMLAAVGYDEANKTLAVTFTSGKKGIVYRYAGVSPEVYEEMKLAKSIGTFFGQRIRGKYETTKIEPQEDQPKPEEEAAP